MNKAFSKHTFLFLKKLKQNNNREWFNENKPKFEQEVMQPAMHFVENFGEALGKKVVDIRYDTSRNGSGSMFRIYRDVRFSKDKSPYKTNLGFVFWRGEGNKKQNPAFYVHVGEEGIQLYGGQYWMAKHQVENFRQKIVAKTSGESLEAIIKKLEKAGITMTGGKHYKRVPRGLDVEHPRAEWLKFTGLYVGMPAWSVEEILADGWMAKAIKQCMQMNPLLDWLKTN
jgi:uncharacterized protein (TIGR02453 family)